MKTRVKASNHTETNRFSIELLRCLKEIKKCSGDDAKIVFVSGSFNVLHPGHLRLLNFAAECGDFLVVGILNDDHGKSYMRADLRLEAVRAISIVNYSFVLDVSPEEFIRQLKPAVVVKGKEHENLNNPEADAVESYGGKLLFSSGDVRFSSLDLLQRELKEINFSSIKLPADFMRRHKFDRNDLMNLVRTFTTLKVVVIGDLIIDEYINCDPLGMSQEDPTIVVSPIKTNRFLGGAGIVAAHARGLGAKVNFLGVVGDDDIAKVAADKLQTYRVKAQLMTDDSRPTTLKQRFRANGKTLLRVSHLRQHDISHEIAENLYAAAVTALRDANLLLFSDFSYGCLPQALVDKLAAYCNERNIMMAADSQASSQVGDVSRFKHMRLVTPTEHEARLAMRDFTSGLVVLAEALRQKSQAEQIFITLASEGLLIQAPKGANDLVTDQLPAFNTGPKDVSGAGDSLLTCSSMALAAGANIWQASYLGSVAAACQVSRVGNTPLQADELIMELSSR